jgi:hypothetical protein
VQSIGISISSSKHKNERVPQFRFSLFEIFIPIISPIRIILANDFEITICKNERIDVFRPGIITDPAGNFQASTPNAAYAPYPGYQQKLLSQIDLMLAAAKQGP